jgi:hypothetical protein
MLSRTRAAGAQPRTTRVLAKSNILSTRPRTLLAVSGLLSQTGSIAARTWVVATSPTGRPPARLMHRARALMQRTAPGKHYGPVTAKALAVLEALLWRFHNAKDGRCFPSYPRIAEAAGCAYSTVSAAIQALEAAGLLEWVNRIKRVRKWAPGLPGIGASRIRVVRTSNAYAFRDPKPGPASKFEIKPGTTTQVLFPSLVTGAPGLPDGIEASLLHLSAGVRSRNG